MEAISPSPRKIGWRTFTLCLIIVWANRLSSRVMRSLRGCRRWLIKSGLGMIFYFYLLSFCRLSFVFFVDDTDSVGFFVGCSTSRKCKSWLAVSIRLLISTIFEDIRIMGGCMMIIMRRWWCFGMQVVYPCILKSRFQLCWFKLILFH